MVDRQTAVAEKVVDVLTRAGDGLAFMSVAVDNYAEQAFNFIDRLKVEAEKFTKHEKPESAVKDSSKSEDLNEEDASANFNVNIKRSEREAKIKEEIRNHLEGPWIDKARGDVMNDEVVDLAYNMLIRYYKREDSNE